MNIKKSLLTALSSNGLTSSNASNLDWSNAVGKVVHEEIMKITSVQADSDAKHVSYLSAEFLMGRMMSNNLHNIELFSGVEKALSQFGVSIYDITDEESDLALGNGGLGRLAACFIDSMTSLGMNATGYGIHYEHGLFSQTIEDCHQVERPDLWRDNGCVWEVLRPELEQTIKLYGNTKHTDGGVVWENTKNIRGIAWDVPIVGWKGKRVNMLRLWEAKADSILDWDAFNRGDYQGAFFDNVSAETVTKVLYPNDDTDAGKELRFTQQYFFCACSLKDILNKFKEKNSYRVKNVQIVNWEKLPESEAIQLNDTHPTLAIPELMRILVDEEGVSWGDAWEICQKTFSYTNHTLLPEALEQWSISLFERVLPRHLEIIYEVNARFLSSVEDKSLHGKLSIVGDGTIRMANLCVVTAHTVNGVAEVHSDLVKSDLFPEYDEMFPGKFVNVTNGVTQRRWLKSCNPELADLYTKTVGNSWIDNLKVIGDMNNYSSNKKMKKKFFDIKFKNKQKMVEVIKEETGIEVSANAIFDVQIKRLHEYKRQQLNLLHILTLYKRLIDDPSYDMHPQVFIFGAKAAPAYTLAKDIIYAINKVGEMVNDDPRVGGKLKVVFLPNYRVSLAEKLIPAADISEQISTAGYEASGTGNMKLSLNGAMTIGTMDGANIEMSEEIGTKYMAIFGLSVDEVKELKSSGYNPYDYYNMHSELKSVLDWMVSGEFKGDAFFNIHKALLEHGDEYLCLADWRSYSYAQRYLNELYRDDIDTWVEYCIINSASMGKFTSDRSILDYQRLVWKN
jgi:glycogen phosphorylase